MAVQQMIDGNPYPIKSAWIQTSNLLGGQAADMRKHYKALMNMEFNVVVDLFHNPTTMACADLILPAATFTEKESFRRLVPASAADPARRRSGGGQKRLGDQLRVVQALQSHPAGEVSHLQGLCQRTYRALRL